jgi:hypothetical protein
MTDRLSRMYDSEQRAINFCLQLQPFAKLCIINSVNPALLASTVVRRTR